MCMDRVFQMVNTKSWNSSSAGLADLKLNGLELLRSLPQEKHIAVHWGMVTAVTHSGPVGRVRLAAFLSSKDRPSLLMSKGACENNTENEKQFPELPAGCLPLSEIGQF